jgi:hypothetical protein
MITTLDRFPGHVAGEPYLLTREEFITFLGLKETYDAILAALRTRREHWVSFRREEPQALWAALAAHEASRTFDRESDYCASAMAVKTEDMLTPDENGYATHAPMLWQYESTSSTFFLAIEYRQTNEFDVLPEPKFSVTIPAERDQPGRSHYQALRRGGTYRDF